MPAGEAGGDAAVSADNEGRRDRQHPRIIALILGQLAAEICHHPLQRRPNPYREVQRHGVTVVHVGQDRERHRGLRLELGGKFLALGHDGNDLAALPLDFLLRPRQRANVDPAVGAPMAAMKSDGNRAFAQQLLEADEVPSLIRKQKRRHEVTWAGCVFSRVAASEPFDQFVNRILKFRAKAADFSGEGL